MLWSPSVKQLFRDCHKPACKEVLAMFYLFAPGFQALEDYKEKLMPKLTLFHGHEGIGGYGSPNLHPEHVAYVELKGGIFHPHVLVLRFEKFARVWIGSMNITSEFFKTPRSESTYEAVYVQDFPLRCEGEFTPPNDSFGDDLLDLLQIVGNCGLAEESTSTKGYPLAKLHSISRSLLRYDLSSSARLVVGLKGDGTRSCNRPRQQMSKLTQEFRSRSDKLVISNGFITEKVKNPTFEEFLEEAAKNFNCNKVRIASANIDELAKMCKLKEKERGLTTNILGGYHQRIHYKGKPECDSVEFVHGKSYVCLDKDGNEVWALVGGFNFSASGK